MALLQVVNLGLSAQNVTVSMPGSRGGGGAAWDVASNGSLTVLSGADPLAENSFEQPLKVGVMASRVYPKPKP